MQNIIYLVLGVLLFTFICVWLWGMWVAFTNGDDSVAEFGRMILCKVGFPIYSPSRPDKGCLHCGKFHKE